MKTRKRDFFLIRSVFETTVASLSDFMKSSVQSTEFLRSKLDYLPFMGKSNPKQSISVPYTIERRALCSNSATRRDSHIQILLQTRQCPVSINAKTKFIPFKNQIRFPLIYCQQISSKLLSSNSISRYFLPTAATVALSRILFFSSSILRYRASCQYAGWLQSRYIGMCLLHFQPTRQPFLCLAPSKKEPSLRPT